MSVTTVPDLSTHKFELPNGNNGHAAVIEGLRGIAVVGLGYWGPNWVRNLYQLRCAKRLIACDLDPSRRERILSLYPGVESSGRFEDLLDDPDVEGVIIATPVSTHYPLARRALEADKSVLVEKPLAMSRREVWIWCAWRATGAAC